MTPPGLSFSLFAFLLVIGPLVFVHEMGHYWVARWFGVHAETFSIGFGPELGAWTDRRGTRWRVGALPFGGYVKFMGDMGVASEPDPKWLELSPQDRRKCFHARPVGQRALIVFAGPAVNLIFATLILAGFAFVYGENVTPAQIGAVLEDSAADQAGLKPGDRIVAIDGRAIDGFDDLANSVIVRKPGDRLTLDLIRADRALSLAVTLGARIEIDRFGNEYRFGQIGVRSVPPVAQPVSLWRAPLVGIERTGQLIGMMAEGLAQIVTGRRSLDELGGPLKIAQISGEQAAQGVGALISFIALVSINLGFINLLPIPMLDGGHLFFYGIEAIQRRPVSARIQEIAFRSGLALLLSMLVLVTFNDLGSFGLWRGLSSLIG
jgi:regulator of sigma E protease